jgi:phytoene desaturase
MTSPSPSKHIVVIGAGPGGLTAAMILARRGFRVTVFEARDRVGGRNAELRLGPYVFDTGPTFLMLKPILEEVFREAGDSLESLLEVGSLEPMYRLQFRDKYIDPVTDHAGMAREIERVFPGRGAGYAKFRSREKTRFKRLYPCLQKSYHRAITLLHPDMLRAIPHLALGRSLYDVMYGYFGDEKLALSFTFQAKYLGMSPWECPGVFSMIPHIEHTFGIQHIEGGLSRISDAMAETAVRNGAVIRLASPVRRVRVNNRTATGVLLESGEIVEADGVVINADFGHAATHLFEPGVLRKYTPAALARKRLSCSTFMLYLGIDQPAPTPHHLIAFADDYRSSVEAIFRSGRLVKDISFYVRNASATDPTLAPPGHAALYVLVPVPNNRSGIDWTLEGAGFRETVLDAIAARTELGDLRPHIRAERMVTPLDWEQDYRIYQGATFNLAHNIGQMLYWRPRNKFEELDRCYLVGGGTHPGSGLPTIYESGRIAANLISRAHQVPFSSSNQEI